MMRMRLLAVVTVLALTTMLPPGTALAETEPNNTMAQANTISVGYNKGHTDATLSSATDVDFYKFTTVANQTYVIETYNIAGTDSDATGLRLYNSGGTEVAQDAYGDKGTGQANARIVIKLVTAGTYYIKVQRSDRRNWTGTYSLRVLSHYGQANAGWDAANDYEPNDTPEIANEIAVGLNNAVVRQIPALDSLVSDGPDQDFYRFTAVAGRTYVVETYNIVGTGSEATGLWLYNSSGAEIAQDQYGDRGTGQSDARLVITLTTGGVYYIKVRQGGRTSWTGTYSLRVLPRHDQPEAAWDSTADHEPNDTAEIANEIGVGLGSAVTRQLLELNSLVSNGPDQDFYRFTAVAGRTYVIETYNIAGNGSEATGLWLYNSTGTQIAQDQYGDNGTGQSDARLVVTLTTGGMYYIRVLQGGRTSWTGTYSLRVLPSYDRPEAAWDTTNDYEPNDVFPLANYLGVGALKAARLSILPTQGVVTNDGDQDFYRFDALPNQTYLIQAFDVQLNSMDRGAEIALFNSSGTKIADGRSVGDSDSFINAELSFKATTGGTYFVRVVGHDYSDWTGPYSLRVCQEVCTLPVYLPLVVR